MPHGICFAPLKCNVMYQDWNYPIPVLTLNNVELETVNGSIYLDSCVSSDGVDLKVSTRVCRANAAYANLYHLW